MRGFGLTLSPIHPPYGGVTVNLESESEKAARFSTEKVLATVTVEDGFGLSDSKEEGKGIYAYHGESRFSSVDAVSFHEVALSRPEQRDRSTASLCSKTGSSDDKKVQEQLIGKPNMDVRIDIHVG